MYKLQHGQVNLKMQINQEASLGHDLCHLQFEEG
jgi:hypothetical protein